MQLPRNAPARAPLTTHGFDIGINSRRHRSFTTKFRAEVVCESAARADPGQAQPERPGVADGETPDLPSSGRRLELARIEAVLTRDAQDLTCLTVTCLIAWAGETLTMACAALPLADSRQPGRWLLRRMAGPLSNL